MVLIIRDFYCRTSQIVVDHGSFIARYGEVDPSPQNIFVKVGQGVKRGEPLGEVGHLVGIKVPSDMLHLELYETTENPQKKRAYSKSKLTLSASGRCI